VPHYLCKTNGTTLQNHIKLGITQELVHIQNVGQPDAASYNSAFIPLSSEYLILIAYEGWREYKVVIGERWQECSLVGNYDVSEIILPPASTGRTNLLTFAF